MSGRPAMTPLPGPRACVRRGFGRLRLAGGPQLESGRPVGVDESAEAAWRVFAPLVAARPVMRVSGDGGRSYPRARVLAAQRPGVPAAVATFDSDGRAPSVVLTWM